MNSSADTNQTPKFEKPTAEQPHFHWFNPLDDPNWDRELEQWPTATFFHTAAWLRVLQDSYGYRPLCLGLGNPDDWHGLFPLMEVDSWFTGRRGIALPFTDECAPLFRDSKSGNELWHESLRLARQRRWNYVECRGGLSWLPGATASTCFFGHQLPLNQSEPQLWQGLSDANQRALRKAQSSQLIIEVAQSKTAIREFYALVCKTRRRQGLPPQPLRFFYNLHRHIFEKDQGCVVMAKHQGNPVAGAVYFRYRDTITYKFGASDFQFQHLRANNLVMWEAIKRFSRQGLARLDFGRTSLNNEGLRRFKASWGAEQRHITYVRYENATGSFVRAPDLTSGKHTFVFRTLPAVFSRLIGRALYRHVA